jgi:subtilisin-like proprotein convertase family protein
VDASFGTAGSLRLVDPDQGRVLEPATTWADIPSSDTAESASPDFELVVFEDTSCGEILELEFDAWASNATTRRHSMMIPMGDRDRDFLKDVNMALPPETTEPVTSTIVIGPDHTVAELDVTVNIAHPDTTELIVELTSPDGTTVRLHDQSDPPGYGIDVRYDLDLAPDGPGTMGDFVGESTQGTWTLAISDVGPVATGSLIGWTLHLTIEEGFDCEPQTCPEPTPTAAVGNLVVDVAANQSDLDLSWSAVGGVAGYHVLQSGTAPFDISVDLTGRTTGSTAITVTDGVSLTPDLAYFQVRAVNSCSQEGP